MTTLYWYCLGGGLAAALLLVLVGEVLEAALDALDSFDFGGAFDPLSAVAGATVFGGAGLLLDAHAGLADVPEVAAAAAAGLAAAVALHVVYVKPMKRSENSTGFSVREYAGKVGEVGTSIPAGGFGEVVVRMGASTTFQTAASFSGDPIAAGTPVVVVEVDADGVLRVAPLEPDETAPSPSQRRLPPRLETRV